MKKKIVIDIGHLGCDIGAVANGIREVDLNLKICRYLVDDLQRQGYEVYTSTGSLQERVEFCNKLNIDFIISIHNNAGGGKGLEIYTYSNVSNKTKELAKILYNELVPSFNNGRGIKTANFKILKETKASAILIEGVFIDNIKDLELLNSDVKIKNYAIKISKGICKFSGITHKEENKERGYFRVQIGAFKNEENAKIMQQILLKKGIESIIKYN